VIAVSTRTDDEGRRLIREALDTTLVVEAAAGTGKTTELITRILNVLAEGRADVQAIVAVTFTERAAGELKLRLRQELEERRRATTDTGVRARIEHAIQHLEEAHVSTIHGFCADLLRERPVEARVDPLFRVLTEAQAERLFEQAFNAWFHAQLEQPPEGVRRSLRRASRGWRPGEVDEDGPMARLRRAAFDLAQWRDLRAPWSRPSFDRTGSAVRLVTLVHRLAELSERPSYAGDNLYLDTAPARRLSSSLRAASDVMADLDGLESDLVELARNRDLMHGRKGSGPGYRQGVTRAQVLDARTELVEALQAFQIAADADLAAALQGELFACVDRYEALKAEEGALDFFDLLVRARDLVRDDVDVRRHFQQRFARLFVDECQDTDPLQAELLLLLAADDPTVTEWRNVAPVPGKLFIVGDPKQSIYRFRRADVAMYRTVCEQLLARGATRVELRQSFRAVPNLQRAVNAAFAPLMDGDPEGLQARYMRLEPSRPDHPGQPSLVALPVPRPYAHRYVAAKAIEQSLPDAVGAYVEWLTRDSRWTVTERRSPGKRVRLEPRHVCVLFRRFLSWGEDVTRPYVEALEARGVRHLLVGGKAFHNREEVETLRAALMAIEWPEDELSVFATLRGALFAITDDDLLEFQHLAGRFHPFAVPPDLPGGLAHIRDALTFLGDLHRERNRVPVAQTIATLLSRTRAHVGFVLRPAGEQALANVLHVAQLARQYERDGGRSFRGFVERLQEEASAGQAAEAPVLEEGSDGVRLMTVHRAKGLEFPVVILADITCALAPRDAGRHVDAERGLCALRIGGWSPWDLHDHREIELKRERREGERLAYVAATRARDLLVVPAVGDGPYDGGWTSPLVEAVYPPEPARRERARAEGCPAFESRDSVLVRPNGDPATSRTVCPGLHQIGTGDAAHTVVWWSPEPASLSLDAQPPLGLRRDDLIVKDVPVHVLKAQLDEEARWEQAIAGAVSESSRPSIRVVTATEWAEALAGEAEARELAGIDVAVEVAADTAARPAGVRFGSLVHAMLARMPLSDESDGALPFLAEVQARMLGADAAERASALEVIRRARTHPVVQGAAAALRAGRCYRETPVTMTLEPGTIVEGVVDLAYDDGTGFVVVDFKTDVEIAAGLERYRRQVQIYAAAIRAATGRPARGVLLRV
jgi:ATP-dependent exoDNAse (exonuclease V) beta subunit